MKATDDQLREWRTTGYPYKVIAVEIATWAANQERGTVLPDNQVFGRPSHPRPRRTLLPAPARRARDLPAHPWGHR
jgi:hypothetical protein